MSRAGTREKRSSEAGQDLTTSSTECPLLPATELLKPPLLTTPSQPALSSFSSSPPQRKVRRAKKRRSPGDLAKRRHRLISFHLSHTPPSTPCKLEPDQSSLEYSCWGGSLGSFGSDSTPTTSRQASLFHLGVR